MNTHRKWTPEYAYPGLQERMDKIGAKYQERKKEIFHPLKFTKGESKKVTVLEK
jgi:hypothetical protein